MFSHERTGRRCGPGRHTAHRSHPFGPGEFGGPPFAGFGWGPRGRGRKARRGDIRTAALLLLAEEPRNGYQIMQEVEERSDGVWRPSPGSVYPALAQLEDEGLIRSSEQEGRRLFVITDEGRKLVEERGEERPAPWEQMSDEAGDEVHETRRLLRDVAVAYMQVVRSGDEAQRARARELFARTRRDLYRVLAEDEVDSVDGEH
jgi:DNA-binding PadR family transcriptional regulator